MSADPGRNPATDPGRNPALTGVDLEEHPVDIDYLVNTDLEYGDPLVHALLLFRMDPIKHYFNQDDVLFYEKKFVESVRSQMNLQRPDIQEKLTDDFIKKKTAFLSATLINCCNTFPSDQQNVANYYACHHRNNFPSEILTPLQKQEHIDQMWNRSKIILTGLDPSKPFQDLPSTLDDESTNPNTDADLHKKTSCKRSTSRLHRSNPHRSSHTICSPGGMDPL